jgi:hypothetical protein
MASYSRRLGSSKTHSTPLLFVLLNLRTPDTRGKEYIGERVGAKKE